MTDIYVVVRGREEYITDVHGVYTYEKRAQIAAEELRRMDNDGPEEWVSVQTHDAVAEPAYEAEEGDD